MWGKFFRADCLGLNEVQTANQAIASSHILIPLKLRALPHRPAVVNRRRPSSKLRLCHVIVGENCHYSLFFFLLITILSCQIPYYFHIGWMQLH